MRRTGTALAVMSILALVVGVTLVTVGAMAQPGGWADKNVYPTTGNLIINYPAFPNSGGPAIVGATYDPNNKRIVLVFNEGLARPESEPGVLMTLSELFQASFALSGGVLDDTEASNLDNVLYITGMDPLVDTDFVDNGAERIRLKNPGVVESATDQSLSREVTWVQIGRGPIPVRVELVNPDAAADSSQTVKITWDAKAAKVGTAVATFGSTDEMSGTMFGFTATGSIAWTLRDSAMVNPAVNPPNFGYMLGGVTKLRVTSGQVKYAGTTQTATDRDRVMVFDNTDRGPILIAAYYDRKVDSDPADDVMWALFNEPVSGSNFGPIGDATANFSLTTPGYSGGSSTLAWEGTTTASIQIKNILGGSTPEKRLEFPGGSLVHNGKLTDFQGQAYAVNSSAVIHHGPGIIRASYNDGQTPGETPEALQDDNLVIWLSEPITNFVPSTEVDSVDFTGNGAWEFGKNIQKTVETDVSGLGKVTFFNFSGARAGKRIHAGSRIRATSTTTPITGHNVRVIDVLTSVPIVDESRPMVDLEEQGLTDRWYAGDVTAPIVAEDTAIDTMVVAWREAPTPAVVGDQFFVFITKKTVAQITNQFLDSYLSRAIPISKLYTGVSGDTAVTRIRLLIEPDSIAGANPSRDGFTLRRTTDGQDIARGEELRVVVASADWTGNTHYRTLDGSSPAGFALLFSSTMFVGPICAPRDFYNTPGDAVNWDSDIIHVTGEGTAGSMVYSVFGDTLAIPCTADQVIAYYISDGDRAGAQDTVRIGAGPVKNPLSSNSSFDPFVLNFARVKTVTGVDWNPLVGGIFLAAKLGADVTPRADMLPIRVDDFFPGIAHRQVFDPWNPYQVYNANDYMNIRLKLADRIRGFGAPASFAVGDTVATNDIATVVADFSNIDPVATNPAGFSTLPNNIVMVGLGRDRVDNDRDWRPYTDTNGNGKWDTGEPVNDDKGLDGIGPYDIGWTAKDLGECDGLPNFGDPYVDEDGSGHFDLGETFVDLVTQATQANVFDPGEPNLDSQDVHERGWYEVQSTVTANLGTVSQGYKLDPSRVRKLSYTDPLSLVSFSLLDNGASGTTAPLQGQIQRPNIRRSLSLGQTTLIGRSIPEQRFLARIDFHEPTVVEFTGLWGGTNGTSPILESGNPVYHFGPKIDFTVSTPSDDDVLFLQMQYKKEADTVWKPLERDPVGDASGEGAPGVAGIDQDKIEFGWPGYVTLRVGDGIGLADLHVMAALDSTGVLPAVRRTAKNDLTDNDNDAYFTYESYGSSWPGGAAQIDPTDPTTWGRIVWWNIDESKTNGLDDNGDGSLFDTGEACEAFTYVAKDDDNEDGIMDGEKVPVYIDGVHSVMGRSRTGTGTTESGFVVWVAASALYGSRSVATTAVNATAINATLQKYYANGVAYTEVVDRGFSVLTLRNGGTPPASERRFLSDGANTGWDTDRLEGNRFDALTSGTTFGSHNWNYANKFNWKTSKGRVMDVDTLSRVLGLITTGGPLSQKYNLRAVAYDLAGNSSAAWSNPWLTFTIDLTPPTADLIGCGTVPTTGPFANKNPENTLVAEIYDAGQHPGSYTLEVNPATISPDVMQVQFQELRQNADGTWPADTEYKAVGATVVNPLFPGDPSKNLDGIDHSAPFTMEWPQTEFDPGKPDSMFTVNNYPAGRYQEVKFRTVATDSLGNVTTSPCVLKVRVIDSTPPSSWIRGVYAQNVPSDPSDRAYSYESNDYKPLAVTVPVPVDSLVDVWARIEDNDRDAKDRLTTLLPGKTTHNDNPYTTMWAAGLDGKTGNAFENEDGGDLTDEDDPGGFAGSDGVFTLGAGPLGDDQGAGLGAGADSIPGPWYLAGVLQPTDDEWGAGVNSDDYITNDVKYVIFQYRVVDPPGIWQNFATVSGDDSTGAATRGLPGLVYDYTSPVKATLNTQYLKRMYGEGLYELRAYACDVEGNCNIDSAPIATINLRSEPLRAYIQPEVCLSNSIFDLYAVHFDYEINKVRFEYTLADANNCAVGGAAAVWKTIGTDDETTAEPRGDAVLYMPGQYLPVTNPDPLHMLNPIGAHPLADSHYKYWDADGDGRYDGASEQVVHSDNLLWTPGSNGDVGAIGDPAEVGHAIPISPSVPSLTAFGAYDYFAQTLVEDNADVSNPVLDPHDWIFRHNDQNVAEGLVVSSRLDRWKMTWDATGLPADKYLVRAIATDNQNNTDIITYTCYAPTVQNLEELELVKVNTVAPHVAFTELVRPDGVSFTLPAAPPAVLYVPGGVNWIKLTTTDGSADSVLFEYRIPGIQPAWQPIPANDFDVFYANINGVPGYQDAACSADLLLSGDELFNDLPGGVDFVKDPGDFFRPFSPSCGLPSKTPDGWALYPRTSGSALPFADTKPFHVYLDAKAVGFPRLMTNTQIEVRATAYDRLCGTGRPDPNPDVVTITWGENEAPDAEVIRAEDLDGALVDVDPESHDHTPVGTIGGPTGSPTDTVRVFVIAQDNSLPLMKKSVDLFYRVDPTCYPDVPQQNLGRPVDLALVLDGSESILPADFQLQKDGVIAALRNPNIIPRDGSVSITVVQFGSSQGKIQIPLTAVTDASVDALIAKVADPVAFVQLFDGTPTAKGINQAVAAIGAGTSGARKIIILATDGVPSQPPDPTDPTDLRTARVAASEAADAAIAHGIDELHGLGIGGAALMLEQLTEIVRNGSADEVSDYAAFSTTIGHKIRSVIFDSVVQMRQWKSMTLAGWAKRDSIYDYHFNIATSRIPDGVYQFYPRAIDMSGNFNEAPTNPWGFKKSAMNGVDFAFVSTPNADSTNIAAVGDEYVIHASLLDPAEAPTTAVQFYYAARRLDTAINPTTVEPVAPFTAPLPAGEQDIRSWATGDAVVVRIISPQADGTVVDRLATYHKNLSDLGPTMFDFTVTAVRTIAFGARPAATDTILVSYDFGNWERIKRGDDWSPYTVAWSQANGGIPDVTGAEAFDLIAIAKFDLNGDRVYEDAPAACDFVEEQVSEGNYLILRDEKRPKVILYGLAFDKSADPFDYPGLNWPGNPLFYSGDEYPSDDLPSGPNYENKLSGFETDVFVKATDFGGGDVASVVLDITTSGTPGGGSKSTSIEPIEMAKYSAPTPYIDVPITFYEDDYYAFWVAGIRKHTKDGWEVAPGRADYARIENVILQISTDGGHTWPANLQYQMRRDSTTTTAGKKYWWGAEGRFKVDVHDSDTQRYQFIVDVVGDTQNTEKKALPDLRNLAGVYDKDDDRGYSVLNVPELPFWYAHIDDAILANEAFHSVTVTATDTYGNVGTNHTAWRPDKDEPQGQIQFVLDQTPPVVTQITALNLDDQPLATPIRVSPQVKHRLMSRVTDPDSSVSVMSTLGVVYQYSPNQDVVGTPRTWVTIGLAQNAKRGQFILAWKPPSPLTDGYDNDGDGLWDEEDEAIANVLVRAIAWDDGLNSGYSEYVLPMTIDAAEPSAALTKPVDGEVFGYSTPIQLVGTGIGDYLDYLPTAATNDINAMLFQARVNGYYYIDRVYGGVGKTNVYDNGIDAVFFDEDGDLQWDKKDKEVFPGMGDAPLAHDYGRDVSGSTPPDIDTPDGDGGGSIWFDLDPTPQDNRDNPWLISANNGQNWEMTWVPNGFSFITADLLGGDEYVRLRMLSHDTAGNWDTKDDMLPPKETVIILNDDSVSAAFITRVVNPGDGEQDGFVNPEEIKLVQGLNGTWIHGILFQSGLKEIVQINMYLVANPDGTPATAAPDTSLIVIDNSSGAIKNRRFSGLWDARPLPDATEYLLFATAIDVDQNESSKHDATKVRVRIDRTPPVVNYTPMGSYTGFTTPAAAVYRDDSIENHSSKAIVPDEFTGDVDLRVTTTASDVTGMELEWRFALDPVGLWRPASELFSSTMQPAGAFDYEPNQDFSLRSETHHVWWLHLENFTKNILTTGRMEFRALATDLAGNTNALQTTNTDSTNFAPYTVDNHLPFLFDWNDDVATVPAQIEVADTVNFQISVQDAQMNDPNETRTDVTRVVLQYRVKNLGSWVTSGDPVVPTGVQIDSGNAMWISEFAWIAPAFVVHDTPYEFRVLVTDAAGNVATLSRPDDYVVTVEDNAAPDRTKIIDVVAQVLVRNHSPLTELDGTPTPPQADDPDPNVWKHVPEADEGGHDVNIEDDPARKYQPGTDWLISEGADLEPPKRNDKGTTQGDLDNTFPRNVGESYLNDVLHPVGKADTDRQIVKIARTVTLVGRTQADDDGIGQADTGIQWVTFLLAPCDANGTRLSDNPDETDVNKRWIVAGRDEYQPGFPLYYWHLFLDTKLIKDGYYVYKDGYYKLAAYAMDEEGNVEDRTTLDWTAAIIQIDNTGPSAEMDKTPLTPRVEPTDRFETVERNKLFTLFARTLMPGTKDPLNTEDDVVYFCYKRARDLNMPHSWGLVDPAAGFTVPDGVAEEPGGVAEDGNPDETRPYSFDVNLSKLSEPTDNETDFVPLSVGEAYDFAVATQDEVGNWNNSPLPGIDDGVNEAVVAAYVDTIPGTLGARHLRLLIQDTIAPHFEFTRAQRKGGDDRTPFENPTRVHAQGFKMIEARILTGDLDVDHVEFVYRPKGTQTWSLIDAELDPSDGKRTWELGEWDLRTLYRDTDLNVTNDPNWNWYDVGVIGVDNVGNVDQAPDIIEVYVDYEAPKIALVAPADSTSKWCRGQDAEDEDDDQSVLGGHSKPRGGPMDLIVEVLRNGLPLHDDVWKIEWLWKLSTDPDEIPANYNVASDHSEPGWSMLGVESTSIYDDATNRYSTTLDLGLRSHKRDVFSSNLYDLRVRVFDVAGNVAVYDVYKNTVDLDVPNYSQISNITLSRAPADSADTTLDPIDQGQSTDVTLIKAGDLVQIFGTASDDEPALPNFRDPQRDPNNTHPVFRFYETLIGSMQFQVAFDLDCNGVADGRTWHDIGVVHLNPSAMGDSSAQSASILWNTSGLVEGCYLLQVISTDECGNALTSEPVKVKIRDWTPPIARIVAWDADQQPHGIPAPSLVEIYALAECDQTDADLDADGWQPRYDVQIQYNVKGPNETVPSGDWVNIGIAKALPRRIDEFTTEQLWSASVDPQMFGAAADSVVWLRALVEATGPDDMGGRYGDKPGDRVQTVLVTVRKQVEDPLNPDMFPQDGTWTLVQHRSNLLAGGPVPPDSSMVRDVTWMVSSPTHVVLTVRMATSEQAPRVVLLSEAANPTHYPSSDHGANYSPGVEDVGLTRVMGSPTVWRGEINLADKGHDECMHYAFWVSGLDVPADTTKPKWIDMADAYMREFTVTEALGTNGTAITPAYRPLGLGAQVVVPSGAWPEEPTCLLVSPTDPPFVSTDQKRYLTPVGKTAYHFEIQERDGGFTHGYEPIITIKYNQTLAEAACRDNGAALRDLTVRRWDPSVENRDDTHGAWVGTGILQIASPKVGEVEFRVRDLSPIRDIRDDSRHHEDGSGNVFQLFAPNKNGPVAVSSIWPNSPYAGPLWRTDADPAMVVFLRDPGGQVIDPREVELLVDDQYCATWLDGAGRAEFIRGNGTARLEYVNQDQTVMELRYSHSTYPRDWLARGERKLTVRWKAYEGTDKWEELTETFSVDRDAPYLKFDGGFVSNPRLSNIGYMTTAVDPNDNAAGLTGKLVVKMYDSSTGILFKHDRPWYFLDVDGDGLLNLAERQAEPCFDPRSEHGCVDCSEWILADWGVKYDVWRIHTPDAQPPDDVQHDIDNIEVRTLLHQGTADELVPWVKVKRPNLEGTPPFVYLPFDQYTPGVGTDTLLVPVAVLGGGMIKDQDVVEITWYSDKSIEQRSDGPGWGCTIDTLVINGEQTLVWSAGCSYDNRSQQMHIYNAGVQDWASNIGSKYVEQRFIVDTSCPVITVMQPATSTVDPAGTMQIEVSFADAGVGVNPDPTKTYVTVLDPSGNPVVVEPMQPGGSLFSNDHFTGVIAGPLQNGEYTIKAKGTDLLGASCEKVHVVKVESLVLAMTEAVAAPNPFNPAVGTAKISFTVSKGSDVTVKIYDFGGLEVATLASEKHYDAGSFTIDWAGEAADHTDLANGAYICRITASDGAKTEEQNLKVVIWRE